MIELDSGVTVYEFGDMPYVCNRCEDLRVGVRCGVCGYEPEPEDRITIDSLHPAAQRKVRDMQDTKPAMDSGDGADTE